MAEPLEGDEFWDPEGSKTRWVEHADNEIKHVKLFPQYPHISMCTSSSYIWYSEWVSFRFDSSTKKSCLLETTHLWIWPKIVSISVRSLLDVIMTLLDYLTRLWKTFHVHVTNDEINTKNFVDRNKKGKEFNYFLFIDCDVHMIKEKKISFE